MDGIEQKSTPQTKKYFLIAVVVIIGLAIIGGGIYVSKKAFKKSTEEKTEVTPTAVPTVAIEQVTPTPDESLVKEDLKIEVLNGTGVPGSAGKAADLLEEAGYAGIKTGNADNYDYLKTVIQIKDSKKAYLAGLQKVLSGTYSLDSAVGTLEESNSFDAIVTLGKE